MTGSIPGKPGQVRVSDEQAVSATQAVVVATEAPAARALLGEAMLSSDSKTEDGVGTANLYFRCVPRASRRTDSWLHWSSNISAGGAFRALRPSYLS